MPSIPLDSRQERIARALLLADRPITAETLAADLHLTDRVVRYNLPAVEAFFSANGLAIVRKPGVGIWAEGPAGARTAVGSALDATTGPSVLDPADRQTQILLALLLAAPDPLASQAFEARLGVSRPTIRRDIRETEAWLEQHRLHLRRMPGVGVAVGGSEMDIRGGLLAAISEAAPPERLARADDPPADGAGNQGGPTGDLEQLIRSLALPRMRTVIQSVFPDVAGDDPALASAALFLGILSRRVREGHATRMNSGRLRSLLDHPAAADASRIADALQDATGQALGRPDIAAIAEGLLGLQIAAPEGDAPSVDPGLIDRILALAAERLHPALAEDAQLRDSLSQHLRRLDVRLRFGLPVSNPLQGEVRRRYPDVYRAAGDILARVAPAPGMAMPNDEVGLLTMYLAGSLERLRLRPKIGVIVVCPAGMATAWILVSRLLAEFPQLEVQQVVSKTALGPEGGPGVELIISTIQLEERAGSTPVVVVGPLLREADVRRLARAIAALPAIPV